MVAIGH